MAEKKIAKDLRTCEVCGQRFQYIVGQTPPTCGAIFCTAMDSWTDEQWAGHVRMVEARQAADHTTIMKMNLDKDRKEIEEWIPTKVPVQLDALDQEALRRRSASSSSE